MRVCFDCRVSMPVDGIDSCAECQSAHDEREAAAAFCRSEHSGIGCDCLVESIALARVLVTMTKEVTHVA